jgi:hypothetical protein
VENSLEPALRRVENILENLHHDVTTIECGLARWLGVEGYAFKVGTMMKLAEG